MSEKDIVVGIDLGTTNSEISAFVDGQIRILGPKDGKMLPSCVGLSPSGELLVGKPARNQQLVYPERTVRSIKRKMGSDETVSLGDKTFTPAEISAIILRRLADWASQQLNAPIKKAVITVPAYFSDAQRSATKEAGTIAGLDVLRIINEPTAASLSYGESQNDERTVMIYDLGGGTFDVSIVRMQGDITEVLASHGNNQLGGDDFNQCLLDHMAERFKEEHGVDLSDHAAGYARLWWAAEEAKVALSSEQYVTVREEALLMMDGKPLHFEYEVSREKFEELIQHLVEDTLKSVTQALNDADMTSTDLDDILLVGGSTRTPLVERVLEKRAGQKPKKEVHPDLCVALGAGVMASRLAGEDIQRVLVDVCPYSFGVSHLGDRGGVPYPHCYKAIIERNSPVPVTKSERFFTASAYQDAVEIRIFQGEDEDALKNILVGDFKVEGLQKVAGDNEFICRMRLDLDGILNVSAIEKETGLAKHIAIEQACKPMDKKAMAAARERLKKLYESSNEPMPEFNLDGEDEDEILTLSTPSQTETDEPHVDELKDASQMNSEWDRSKKEAIELIARCKKQVGEMHEEDREEAEELMGSMQAALEAKDAEALKAGLEEIRELLFFMEEA